MSNSSTSQYLSYETVKSTMEELNGVFSSYYSLVDSLDKIIEGSFNAGDDSALSSKLGSDFLSKWNSAALTFENFKKKFDNYYANVLSVTKTTSDFESGVTAIIDKITDEVEEVVK